MKAIKPHKISQLYVIGHADVNARVDITDVVDTKIEAILCHITQIRRSRKCADQLAQALGRRAGDGYQALLRTI